MDLHDPERRRLIVWGAGALALGGCSAPMSSAPAPVGDVPAVNVSSLALDSLEPIGSLPVCIGRDSGGVYAMTLTCTHMGCPITTVSFQGLACRCHGSQFDANGAVTNGPAVAALDHFNVTEDASGNLTIHGAQIVGASQRLKV